MSTRGAPRCKAERLAHRYEFAWLARAGLVARGVVYEIIGILAVKLALGDSGDATDEQGALQTIARQTFGKVLLELVAVGLAGYALWRSSARPSATGRRGATMGRSASPGWRAASCTRRSA